MKTFREKLKKKMKDSEFREAYDTVRRQTALAVKIAEERDKAGLSQSELAKRAKITQQQLSKIENGTNCNMATFFKVCDALDLNFQIASN